MTALRIALVVDVFYSTKGVAMTALRIALVLLVLVGASAGSTLAGETGAPALAQANNPLANMKAFNLQNYYTPVLYGVSDRTSNTFWLRYAQPIGPVLIRASLPLATVPVGGDDPYESGIGDFNIFGAYLAVQKPSLTLGIGPLLAAPTATEDALGADKWQAGAAMVAFAVPSPAVQVGGLVTWQGSFAGNEDRDDTSLMAIQPFAIWQLGGGLYMRSSGIAAFDLKSGNYHVPFGLGVGKVSKVGSIVFNFMAEPQFTILHKGMGKPALQMFFGLNLQFL